MLIVCNVVRRNHFYFSYLQVRTIFLSPVLGLSNWYFSLNSSFSIWKASVTWWRGRWTLPGIFPGSASSELFLTSIKRILDRSFLLESNTGKFSLILIQKLRQGLKWDAFRECKYVVECLHGAFITQRLGQKNQWWLISNTRNQHFSDKYLVIFPSLPVCRLSTY